MLKTIHQLQSQSKILDDLQFFYEELRQWDNDLWKDKRKRFRLVDNYVAKPQ